MDTILALGGWAWLVAGLALMGLELLAPGVFMFWLGLAALLVGLVTLAVDWSWQAQLLCFVGCALASVPLWRRFATRDEVSPDSEFLNRRTEALVGRVLTLDKPIVDGVGTVGIDDTIWRVAGPDAPAGSRVKVVKADGANLTVDIV